MKLYDSSLKRKRKKVRRNWETMPDGIEIIGKEGCCKWGYWEWGNVVQWWNR